ncbi:TY-Chap domain-containing protein [Intrasporangium sp. YIM S08009]|uniref:TY-Chap domain-containing protein n=1 Tax=Intrasporangium zincisolvens TaxID=3080018 RepID=UPI002B053DB7|nr:hypothetical protein [Intrasporangium sp. YIM S08009]
MTDALEETWEAWTARMATDLAALTEDDWMTFTVHVPSRASTEHTETHGTRAPRGWRRAGARSSGRPRVPDVFVQVRRVGSVVALECIGDTEFEGLTDLTRDQQSALAELGWEREGPEPEFSRTFTDAAAAARLVRASLTEVLGAATPADVDLRRAPRPQA